MDTVTSVQFGQLPAVRLQAPDGAQATITLFGAHLTSWVPAGGSERLFCSTRSALDGSKAIRGGVPLIFPQFAARGDGMRHGFARVSTWRLADSGVEHGAAFAEFLLSSSDPLAAAWLHGFELRFRVTLKANTLQLALRVHNSGSDAFSFAAALHTYFKVDDLAAVTIDGLEDTRYSDQTCKPPQDGRQTEPLLRCPGQLDRLYHATAGDLLLWTGSNTLNLQQQGFRDTVVWNPGPADAAALSDLADEEFHHFICIEPAQIDPCRLQPGQEWLGVHRLQCT
jgi:glucose-6-phosphate 1-epimerase